MDVTPPHSKIIKQQKKPSNVCHPPPPPYNPWTRVCARGQTCICTVNDICFNFFIELYYILHHKHHNHDHHNLHHHQHINNNNNNNDNNNNNNNESSRPMWSNIKIVQLDITIVIDIYWLKLLTRHNVLNIIS